MKCDENFLAQPKKHGQQNSCMFFDTVHTIQGSRTKYGRSLLSKIIVQEGKRSAHNEGHDDYRYQLSPWLEKTKIVVVKHSLKSLFHSSVEEAKWNLLLIKRKWGWFDTISMV